jgi:hypothetical protein
MPKFGRFAGLVDVVNRIPAGAITGSKLANATVTGTQLANNSVGTANVTDGALRVADLSVFKSTEQTGNGSAQNIAHGLGVVPGLAFVILTDTTAATVGSVAVVEGSHDGTNCVFTVTNGKKYKVVAIA